MQSRPVLTLTVVATEAIIAHRFVTLAGALGQVYRGALGVARTAAASGETFPVDVLGTTVITLDGTVEKGQYIMSEDGGVGVAATRSRTRTATIAGGAAGALTVPGIRAGDRIVSVTLLNRDATAANITLATIADEFVITADNTISNGGAGTSSTGDALLVIWETENPVMGIALQDGVSGDRIEMLLTPSA